MSKAMYSNRWLTALYLQNNSIGDAGAKFVAKVVCLCAFYYNSTSTNANTNTNTNTNTVLISVQY